MVNGLSGERMLIGLAVGIAVLIFLVLKTKIQAFLALIISTVVVGVIGGMPLTNITIEVDGVEKTFGIVNSITSGFGGTLGSIGIIIGFGVMMGQIFEVTGAAKRMAHTFLKLFGKKREEEALALTGFLVSIPMTTVNGDNWLYDVHVYPKNKTTYGSVTLEKKGNNTTALSGVTFVLQKKTGDTWANVTTNEKTGKNLKLETDNNGKINVEGLSQGTYRFIETDRGTNNYGYIMDGATAYQFTVNANGTITYGTKTEANIAIPVNNEKPDMTKQVQKREDNTWGQDADYNVGDMVPYKITVDVPSNITKLKEFTLTDTPTNLDDKLDTVNVTCESADVEADAGVYSVEKEGKHGFKIKFTPENMDAYKGKQLVITYNAELLSTAVTTTDGNTNSAKLEYSNKILPDTDDGSNPNKPGEPGKDSIKNTTTVYTFGLQVVKKAENENGKALEGVQFDLYKEVPAGTTGAASAEEVTAAGLDSAKTWLKINKDPLTTNKKGIVSQSGLANGIYYLVETKTNEGYNLLKAPVKVELNIEYTTTKSVTDENGVKHEVTRTEFKENNSPSNGIHTETIINKKGFTLPTTGGMGTIAITALGVALAFAGVLIIGASRKKTVK